jgi:pSer/pThr/pTyr-binding forkhead associated (FHA) protein
MIICRSCGTQNLVNMVFCDECGQNLLEQSNSTPPARSEEQEQASPNSLLRPLPRMIRVIILNSRRVIDIPYGRDALIGRRDAPRGIIPDVDLSNEGGFEAGVSRRHAQVCYQEDQAFVQDLASTNGTLLNQKSLSPYLAQPLHHGDEIKLGSFVLRVEFR